jgi:hypothetical protein
VADDEIPIVVASFLVGREVEYNDASEYGDDCEDGGDATCRSSLNLLLLSLVFNFLTGLAPTVVIGVVFDDNGGPTSCSVLWLNDDDDDEEVGNTTSSPSSSLMFMMIGRFIVYLLALDEKAGRDAYLWTQLSKREMG